MAFVAQISPSGGGFADADLRSGANLDPAKMRHRHAVSYGQKNGTDVTTETKMVHIAKAAGTIQTIEVVSATAPTGGDKAFTVDLHKSTGGGAFATVLSAVVTVNSSDTDRVIEAGTLSTATYADGDIFAIVVTTSGSTGSQGQGLCVTVNFDEQPS